MITEDYVSFETAKLLKEKGFDSECDYLYINGDIARARGGKCNWNKGETIFTDYKNECSAPTLQMAMKWLREIHNITIDVFHFRDWKVNIKTIPDDYFKADYSYPELKPAETYEEVCEAAIRYCLENLI